MKASNETSADSLKTRLNEEPAIHQRSEITIKGQIRDRSNIERNARLGSITTDLTRSRVKELMLRNLRIRAWQSAALVSVVGGWRVPYASFQLFECT